MNNEQIVIIAVLGIILLSRTKIVKETIYEDVDSGWHFDGIIDNKPDADGWYEDEKGELFDWGWE